jgi:hypothetical protein
MGHQPTRAGISGMRNIKEAVEACKSTGLTGWALVAYAQNLVARKMAYSRHNIWPSPSHAFEIGAGYCQQQALALKQIYNALGISAWPVFATRCRFPPKVVEGISEPERISPHTWLRVRIGGKVLDVCPGSTRNSSGVVQFQVLSTARPLWSWFQPIAHWSSVLENLRRSHEARRLV